MKRSPEESADADLVDAFRYGPEEIAALERAAQHRPLSLEEYLDYCTQFPDTSYEQHKSRPGPRGKRFRL